MKLIFKTKELIDKLKNITPTAEAKQTLAILGNVKVTVKGQEAEFVATDLEIQVSTKVQCEAGLEGDFTAPAKKLLEICSALSSHDELTFNYTGSKVDITAGKSKVSLQTIEATDYPNMESGDIITSISMPQSELSNIINKTSFAMAYQDARHFLNGLHVCTVGGKLVSVCTDGHRLAKHTTNIDCEKDISLIIPRKAIVELNRILTTFNESSDNLPEVSISNNMATFSINGYILITKLIEGSYPNFNKVIPETTKSKIILNKTLFKNSLNIISKVVNQQYKGVKLTPTNNSLHLISSNTDSEVGEDQIDASYDGEELSIGFNISYLQDVIDVIDCDIVEIHVNDQNSGCVLVGNDTQDSTYVIMPMRV